MGRKPVLKIKPCATRRAPWWDAKAVRDGARLEIIMGRVARVLGYEFDEDWATRCPSGMKHHAWTFDVDLYMSYSNDLYRLKEIPNLDWWVKKTVERSPRKLRMFLEMRAGIVDEEWVRKFRQRRASKPASPILPIADP